MTYVGLEGQNWMPEFDDVGRRRPRRRGRRTSKSWLGRFGVLVSLQPLTCDMSWGSALVLGPVLGVGAVLGLAIPNRAIRKFGTSR